MNCEPAQQKRNGITNEGYVIVLCQLIDRLTTDLDRSAESKTQMRQTALREEKIMCSNIRYRQLGLNSIADCCGKNHFFSNEACQRARVCNFEMIGCVSESPELFHRSE